MGDDGPADIFGIFDLVPGDQSTVGSDFSRGSSAPVWVAALVEQGYKQLKDRLGWADFMVRGD